MANNVNGNEMKNVSENVNESELNQGSSVQKRKRPLKKDEDLSNVKAKKMLDSDKGVNTPDGANGKNATPSAPMVPNKTKRRIEEDCSAIKKTLDFAVNDKCLYIYFTMFWLIALL